MHFCVSVGVRRGDHTLRCGEGGGGKKGGEGRGLGRTYVIIISEK